MFERFTVSARRVVVLAQEEARLLDHNYIGTEHVLLGLIAEHEGVAAQVLMSFDVDLDHARAQVLEIIGRGGTPPSGHIPFTPRAKKVLELALREALQLGHNYLGTEHILLGLCREGEGVGAQVLGAFGVDLGRARNAVLLVLSGHRAETDRDPSEQAFGRPLTPQRLPWGTESSRPRCLLCGRSEGRVRHLLVSRGMSLCDECVRDAAAELDALAEDAPTRVRFRRRYPGPEDQLSAMSAIEQAVTAVFGSDGVDESLWAVEDGVDLRGELGTMKDAAAYARVVVNDITLGSVDFLGDTEAQVILARWTIGSSSPMTVPVHAVLQDGTWKVGRATIEDFAQSSRRFGRPD